MSFLLTAKILKFFGLIVGLSISIWGLTQKTTTEGPNGEKHVTPAGQVAIGLAVLAFLTAAGSFYVETVVTAQQAAEEAHLERIQEIQKQAARDEAFEQYFELMTKSQRQIELTQSAARKQNELLRKQIDSLALSSKIANRQLRTITQNAEIANRQSEESARATERFASTAAALLRAVQPLNEFDISVHWFVNATSPLSPVSSPRRRASWDCERQRFFMFSSAGSYPSMLWAENPWLNITRNQFRGRIEFYLLNNPNETDDGSVPDLVVKFGRMNVPYLMYDCENQRVSWDMKTTSASIVNNTGRILSIADFEGAEIKVHGDEIISGRPSQIFYPCANYLSINFPSGRGFTTRLEFARKEAVSADKPFLCGIFRNDANLYRPRIFTGRIGQVDD